MSLSGILISAATTSTNVDPTTLGTKSPYPTPYVDRYTPSAAWTTQAATNSNALIAREARYGSGQVPLQLLYVPSAGAAVTYTIVIWKWCHLAGTWAKDATFSTTSYTGNARDRIENPDDDAIWLQVSALSSGTLAIYFDNGIAKLV